MPSPVLFEKILADYFEPVLLLNEKLIAVWVNNSFAEITGIPKSKWENNQLFDILKQHLNEKDLLLLKEYLLKQEYQTIETPLKREDTHKWIRWEIKKLSDSQHLMISIADITQEIKRRQITDLSQQLSEEYLTQTNANEYFNAILTQLLAVTESEYGFMGEVFYENGDPYLKTYAITNISWNKETSDFYNQFAPTGMEFRNLNTLFGYAMLSKAPVITNNPSNHPKKGGIPKGHPPLNAFLGIPVLLSDGEMVGLIGLANKPGGYAEKDIDDLRTFLELFGAIIKSKKNAQEKDFVQKQLRQTLAEKEALLTALNNSAIVSITDLHGKIISVNTIFCQVSGYNEEELIGQNHNIINSGLHDEAFWKDLWRNIIAGKTWRAEICNRAKDGSLYWVDTVINPIYGPNGEIHQFLAIRYLITQRKEAEENLAKAKDLAEASLRTKRRFLANMSHEIRTPLHAILGLGEQITQGIMEEGQKEQMKLINESARALLSIINDIIDISRMEEGKMKLDYVAFDLKHIVISVFKLLQTYARKKELDFELIYDPALEITVLGDPVRLRQILINILGNAIKFTEKGMVRLHCKASKKEGSALMVSFICEDTGIGISDDMKKRMFQDFSQEDETFQRKFGGSGLGLAITSELVKMMDGTIDIESQKEVGTKVFINIPVESTTQAEKQSDNQISINREKLKRIKVLIAEDNQFNRVLIQIIFNNNQIPYDMAVNGLEAFEMASKEEYDILLMDIQMPEMDGIESMQRIRETSHGKLPIIAVTANAIPEELNHYLELGFNDFITKPFSEEALLDKMLKFV